MNRDDFDTHWYSTPKFKCPRCHRGTLLQHGQTLAEQTEYSRQESESIDWEPEWMTVRFVMLLKCDESVCGEVVTVAGTREVTTLDDYETHQQIRADAYHPCSVVPGPHVFAISKGLSEPCRHHLAKAFELIWADAGASANRIRIFLERLMDQYNIPTEGPTKKDPTKIADWTLGRRIEELEKSMPGHKDAFDALRWVGNEGSHAGKAKRDTLLDCFEILENALEELVDNKKSKLSLLAKNLIATKGKG